MEFNLNKKKLILDLTGKEIKDYSYLIGFFLIFSFFIFFVIRPNLKSLFESYLLIEKLKKDDSLYEKEIVNIINIQEKIINSRNDLPIINSAVTFKPEINQLINDIIKAITNNYFIVDNFSFNNVNLKDISKKNILKPISFSLKLTGNFPNLISLINEIHQQRRLKLIKSISITKEINQEIPIISTESASLSSESAQLKINLIVEGYYL